MKAKNLKSYDIYEKEHIKENFMFLSNASNVANFNDSDKNLEDIKENDEEVISSDNSPEAPKPVGLGTEEEKKIDMPIIAHIEIATETEIPVETSETLPISEPVNTNNFDPKQDNMVVTQPSYPTTIQDCNPPQTFSIVRIMTQNGEKIGMCYTDEVGEYGTPIHNHLDFNAACELVKKCCTEHSVGEFRNDADNIVGHIPTFMIPKKNKGLGGGGSTSYIPN